MEVGLGIDTHKFNLGVGVTDLLGKPLGTCDFGNNADEWAKMLEWSQGFGKITLIGVEGSGHYGAGLVEWLKAQGLDVREVPAHMTFVERKRRPSKGKSDRMDGIRIARVLLREGDTLPTAGRDQMAADLKALVEYRDQLVRALTQQANRTHALLSIIRPGAFAKKAKMTTASGLSQAVALVRGDRGVRAQLIRLHVAEIRRLSREITKADGMLKQLVVQSCTTLTEEVGVGTTIAAKIMAETKAVGMVRSKAGFAMLSGTAPIPASSGQITRYRLNRGGNRRLNHAIHMVAVSRIRLDAESKKYFERKLSEGKTKKEALRSLKRQVANRIYKCLEKDAANREHAGEAADRPLTVGAPPRG